MAESVPRESSVMIREIMDFLPHRYPFLLFDRMESMSDDGCEAVGLKNVTATEPWFLGHYPRNPVFPGVLMLESIAQVAAVLVMHHAKTLGRPVDLESVYFMTADKVRFRRPVVPGDQMRISVSKIRNRGMAYKFAGRIFVGDVLVAEGRIMAVNHSE